MDTKNDLKLGGALVPVPITTAQVNSLEATAVTGSLVYNGTIDEWMKFDGTDYVLLNTDTTNPNQNASTVPFSGGVNFPNVFTVGQGLVLLGNQVSDLQDDVEEAKKTVFFHRESNGASDNTLNLNNASGVVVNFGGATISNDPDSAFSALNILTVRVNYTGTVRVDYNIPYRSTGQRNHLKSYVRKISSGVTTEHGHAFSYIRGVTNHFVYNLTAYAIMECNSGDIFSIITDRQGSNATAANISALSRATVTFTQLEES